MRSANIRRDGCLKFLNTWQDRDVIKVLSGVASLWKIHLIGDVSTRPKSTGVQAENIIAINFEFMKNKDSQITVNYMIMYCPKLIKVKKNYVFLDEIQHVTNFRK